MLTIVIPTKNRSIFLSRLLKYYASVGCRYRILIGDSSNDEEHARFLAYLTPLQSKLCVEYVRLLPDDGLLPGQGTILCTKTLLERVNTPYAAWNPDDDFLVPATLEKCVVFLEKHPDYSAAHGRAILFETGSDDVYGRIEATSIYPQYPLEYPDSTTRLRQHLICYAPTEFSVKRTKLIRDQWQKLFEAKLNNLFGELFISCLTSIEGKIKMFEDLYMIRQAHSGMTSVRSMTSFDFLSHNDFSRQLDLFQKVLLKKMESLNVNKEESEEAFRAGYWGYLLQSLGKQWQQRYNPPVDIKKTYLRKLKKMFPALANIWANCHSLFPAGQMELKALLRPSSPYHKDFMSVYQVVSKQ